MTTLTWNGAAGCYMLRCGGPDDERRAKAAGLTLAVRASRAAGRPVYFTADYSGRASDNPYAVLAFAATADGEAASRLAPLVAAEAASRATASPTFEAPCPPGRAYMPFQLAGIEYALERSHCVIGDEPGLGKTVQAVGLANAVGARRVLVVCPASLRLNWRREIRAWSTIPDVSVYPVMRSRDGCSPYAHYVVVSYDLAGSEEMHSALCEFGRQRPWDLLVLDEAHMLKTYDARRTRAVFGGGHKSGEKEPDYLARGAKRVLALTGTPLPNRPRECYTIVRNLCWDAVEWASAEAFAYRYNPSLETLDVDPKTGKVRRRVIERKGRLPELQARLRTNLMVRRLKKDVLHELPPKRYELSYVEETGAIRKALQAERMLDIDPAVLLDGAPKVDGAISTARRMMGEAKVPLVVDHVETLIDSGVDKLLLFAHHRSVMDALAECLGKFGLVRIDGSTPSGQRQALVDAFQDRADVRVYLGQLQAGGVGLTLTAGAHVVFAEASWTPGENEQCIDRAHRHGQVRGVLAQFLVAAGSLDERILGRAIEKTRAIHATLDEKIAR